MGKGLYLAVILIVSVCIVGLFLYSRLPLAENQPEINMQEKINTEISGSYSIVNYDWAVWSKTFKDSGGTLTRMGTWEQFKESYRQSIHPITIELDEDNRVVWFKGAMNHAVYCEY